MPGREAPPSTAKPLEPEPRKRSLDRLVHGDVRIKGTEAPVSGLVARAFAVGPEGGDSDEVSLGSALVAGGRFEIRFADELVAPQDGQPPSIRIKVFGQNASKPLAKAEVRGSSGREEFFMLVVDAEALAEQGRPDALGVAATSADPAIAARAVAATRSLAEGRSEVVVERKATVADLRRADVELDARIRDRALSELTGVSTDSNAWKRFVRPGKDAVEVANAYQETIIKNVLQDKLKNEGTETYLVLSEEEFAALGDPPNAAKVRALLTGERAEGGVVRSDPLLALCRQTDIADPFAEPKPPSGQRPSERRGPSLLADEPNIGADEKLEQLVSSIEPPDNLHVTGPQGEAAVAGRVLGLSIPRGPADLPATYEFHRLELAFDHVWEDARAEGYIEAIKAAYRRVEAAGGDTDAALESSDTLVRALQREARIAGATPTQPGRPGVIYMQPKEDVLTPKLPDDTFDIRDMGLRDDTPTGLPPEEPTQPTPEADPNLGHPFTVFAANTVNFGLLVTYQQLFEPQDYQVGRMVGTRTLGPKETYSFTTRQVLKKSFNRKQMESNQRMKREDSEDSSRDEAEVVQRAQSKSNFAMSTSGGYDLGPIGEGTVSTNLGTDSESSSQETKRSQRAAVRKAAQEVKNETRIELESAEVSEVETTEKREVTNVNDELALTCVFYELQRRFKVSEQLHRITPVALVAQKVPSVAEINEAWILRYDWIIRRFLPDDSFEQALTYLVTSAAGDRLILQDLKTNMEDLRKTVHELGQQVSSALATAKREYDLLRSYVDARANVAAADKADGWLQSLWGAAVNDDEAAQLEKIRILEESTKERYEKAADHERDLRARMDRELSALQLATDKYTNALANSENQKVQINRLVDHVRQNILLYMHGIWSYEHPDQRFLRHHALTAPRLSSLQPSYVVEPKPGYWPPGVTPEPDKIAYKVTFKTSVDPDVAQASGRATLAELVDLHAWIGMFGNYLIYPLRDSNALTDFMMLPYVDGTLGLRDPDALGNWTLAQFSEYVTCLRDKLSEADFAKVEPILRQQYEELLTSPHRNGEEISIPSNGVYMQMLVDTGKVLEEFKEAHRRMDVLKVREEVRAAAIDNVRRAKMVLAGEFEDPNVESVKNVFYRGPAPHDGDE